MNEIIEQSIFSHENGEIQLKGKNATYTVVNEQPLVVVIHQLLEDEECKAVIKSCEGRLEKSKIRTENANNNIRTSSSMFFEKKENKTIEKIEEITSQVMCIGKDFGEGIQVLNYKPGEQFKAHHDYFKEGTKSAENNRISTLIMYLNDVEEGGETTFPLLDISVSPKKGDAIYFEYFYNNQRLNELTLHTGNPVLKGEKWAATQWMHKRKY